jgi:outer membrane protein OmpA-like peptidoglycan-associated protein
MTIKDFPDVSWEVRGFCDATGNDLINDELASQRIQSVINHLNENYQIDKSSFQPIIIGNKELNSPYDAINRRVDIVPINN